MREIYAHTIDSHPARDALGGYQALPAKDIFDVEYWDLEQAKLRKAASRRAFAGRGRAGHRRRLGHRQGLRRSLLARGAAVVGLDLNPAIAARSPAAPDFLGLVAATSRGAAGRAMRWKRAVRAFGGLDMLVLNAGIFPGGTRIEALARPTNGAR